MKYTLLITIFAVYCCADVVTISEHNGAPAFFVDGKPEFPLFLFEQEILDKDAYEFKKAGFKFYSCIELTKQLEIGWVGDYEFDTSAAVRVVNDFHKRNDQGYIMPRIHLYAPKWWAEKHPEEMTVYIAGNKDTYDGIVWEQGSSEVSFASEKWRKEAGEGLRQNIRALMALPCAGKILGVQISHSLGGEWHYWNPFAFPDAGEPMRKAFAEYMRKKYDNDIDKLRKAWHEDLESFDAVAVPSMKELNNSDVGMFRNPSVNKKVIDYQWAFHQICFDAIEYFCKIVKEESNGKLLTTVCYAYLPDINWTTFGDHRATERLLSSKYIDMIDTPHSYSTRALGESGYLRNYAASLKVNGKILIDESDDRTHLGGADISIVHYHTADIDEVKNILKRAFANVVSNSVGMWYMDQTSGTWYNHPEIYALFSNIRRWADYSMTLSRSDVSEVAVISSMESGFYHLDRSTAKDNITISVNRHQTEELHRSGAPFARYFIEDIAKGKVKPHKVYVFVDCFYLSQEQRLAIEQLKKDGNTLVWFYAPGFVTEDNISLEAMEKLTGFNFKLEPRGDVNTELRLVTQKFGDDTRVFGGTVPQAPAFYVEANAKEIWAKFTDHGYPGMAVREFDGWRSVYCYAGAIPSVAVRELYKLAGVHIYLDSPDNVYVNESWIGIHCASSGTKTVRLPKKADVYEVFTEKLIGKQIDEFNYDMKFGDTALLVLSEDIDGLKCQIACKMGGSDCIEE